jgi:hypothetical protein
MERCCRGAVLPHDERRLRRRAMELVDGRNTLITMIAGGAVTTRDGGSTAGHEVAKARLPP